MNAILSHMIILRTITRILPLCLFALLVACTPSPEPTGLKIRVVADGRERAFVYAQAIAIGQFLQRESIQLGEFDKVYPPILTPLTDGVTITIVRVTEREECTEEEFSYPTLTRKTDELPPGEKRVIQAGVNGKRRTCAKITLEDGLEKNRVPAGSTITAQPREEIIALGIDNKTLDPVLINGVIAYISNGQARLIEGNTVSQRTLPTDGSLDGRVFSLSATGRGLLYTRSPLRSGTPTPAPGATRTINELYYLDLNAPDSKPFKLLEDVLHADWIPGRPNTFSYSTGRWSEKYPDNHEAFNDLIIATLDPKAGKINKAQKLVSTGINGLYSFWGTQFEWSPDGERVAWAQADGVGTIDTKTGKINKLFDFKVYSATLPRGWVWTPSLSWTPDSVILAATVHGAPEANEQPDASPIFDLRLAPERGGFEATLVGQIGMWARPSFSPLRGEDGYLVYLKARDSLNSLNSEYDVMLADRDGSNATPIFPGTDKQGLRPVDDFSSELVWNTEGTAFLCIYQGNIWLINTGTRRAVQVTVVDDARLPRWSR
jgi:hypothetical protein